MVTRYGAPRHSLRRRGARARGARSASRQPPSASKNGSLSFNRQAAEAAEHSERLEKTMGTAEHKCIWGLQIKPGIGMIYDPCPPRPPKPQSVAQSEPPNLPLISAASAAWRLVPCPATLTSVCSAITVTQCSPVHAGNCAPFEVRCWIASAPSHSRTPVRIRTRF